ncbi:MAG: hypothetical protein VB080_14925 [Propionicimonas sp.]|uniref:hypothetical protein n=1 Tax=Propionicimonas sp. TaxID=1955623 RepID=UPI002B209265|nr:hypothetical protein [Propionicimonas sp.]MEA4945713.1 hypothetical protein [Propionicimonas sp.]
MSSRKEAMCGQQQRDAAFTVFVRASSPALTRTGAVRGVSLIESFSYTSASGERVTVLPG